MKTVLFFFILLSAPAFAQHCPCNDLGDVDHKRAAVKNRHLSAAAGAETRLSTVLHMVVTPAEKTEIHEDPDSPVGREQRTVQVTGYAWVIKVSDEDCDIHIEMSGSPSRSAGRIIAEIPNTTEYCALHARVLAELRERLDQGPPYRFDNGDNEGEPLKLTVTGRLFWDSGHPSNFHHGTSSVGSVWEIHPVSKLEWEE